MPSGNAQGIPHAPAPSTERPTRVEIAVVTVALTLYLVLHSFFTVPAFGESDAARLAVDAARFHFSGHVRLDPTDYRVLASPLYIHWLKLALGVGVPVAHLPVLMTRISLISSAVTLLATYFLFRQFIGQKGTAVAAGLLVSAPAFWLAGAYGTPDGPGLSVFLLALLAFSRALDEGGTPRFWKLAGLATSLVFVSLAFKIDLVLGGLAFPGLVFARRRLTRRNAAAAIGVVVLGLAVQLLYVKCIVTPLPSITQFLAEFSQRFPFELGALTDKMGVSVITHAPGPYLFVVGLFALLALVFSRRHFRLGVLAAAWLLPIVLFWGLLPGNSARHVLPALPPLMLAVGSLVARLTGSGVRAIVLALSIAGTNYFSDRAGEPRALPTAVPRTNLLELSEVLAEESADVEKWARGFAKIDAPQKALVGRSSLPFAVFETMADAARHGGRPRYDGNDLTIVFADGHTGIVKIVTLVGSAQGNAVTKRLREEGYTVLRRD
jgi:hypothetical protein